MYTCAGAEAEAGAEAGCTAEAFFKVGGRW